MCEEDKADEEEEDTTLPSTTSSTTVIVLVRLVEQELGGIESENCSQAGVFNT